MTLMGTPDIGWNRSILLWITTFIAFILVVYFVWQWAGPGSKPFVYAQGLANFGGYPLWNVVGAFVIGAASSAAFLLGVVNNFIPFPMKDAIVAMTSSPGRISLFIYFGGFIAAVFQLGQPNAFGPIQSMVIGVTWPSVIGQYLTQKADGAGADFKKLAQGSGQQAGGTATVIGA